MMKNIKILVSYFDKAQMPYCDIWPKDFFEPWDVGFNLKSKFLELDLLNKMYSDGVMSNYEYSGLISHSAYEKLAMDPTYIKNEIINGISHDVDVILINPSVATCAFFRNTIEQGQCYHNQMAYIFDRLGFNSIINSIFPYYTHVVSSYVIGTKKFWDIYFEEVNIILDKINYLNINDKYFNKIFNSSANYTRKINLTYAPFVIERMMQVILNKHQFKIKYIEHTNESLIFKFKSQSIIIQELYNLRKKIHNSNNDLLLWEAIRRPFLIENGKHYKELTRGDLHRNYKFLNI
jgi:hypothetical protein